MTADSNLSWLSAEGAGTSTGFVKGDGRAGGGVGSLASFSRDWSLPILSSRVGFSLKGMSWARSCGVTNAAEVVCDRLRECWLTVEECAVALSRLALGGAAVALTLESAWMLSRRRGSLRTE